MPSQWTTEWKKRNQKRKKYLNLASELRTLRWRWYQSKLEHNDSEKRAGWVGNRRTIRDYEIYYIVEDGQNTEKSSGDLWRLETFGCHSYCSERPVTYWPRPSCQKKKCTCVNNRCIQSNKSGGDLDCRGVELSANCDAHRKLVDVKLLYNPSNRKFRSVGEKILEWEPCSSRGWAPRPPVEQPRKTGKKGCDSQKSWGEVNMLQSLFGLQLTSHTVKPFVTLSNPFELRERYIFLKNCVRSSLLCWICFGVYMCMYSWLWLYNRPSANVGVKKFINNKY